MRCRAARQLRKLAGRRGTYLGIVGVGQLCWGAGMVVDAPSPAGLQLLAKVAPLHCWAWVWVIAGLAAAASAILPVGRDTIGFIAILIPPAVWAITYAVAAINGDFSRGGFVAVWYLTSHVGVTLWAAALPEYSVPKVPRRPRE